MDKDNEYVSKGEVILALLDKGQSSRRYKLGETWELNLFEIQEAIDDMPPANISNPQEFETTEWVDCGHNAGAKCGFCGCRIRYKNAISGSTSFYQFCPKCGKRMKPMQRWR